jgi:predicted  nucleic acid-binding Zn-ribbon protein
MHPNLRQLIDLQAVDLASAELRAKLAAFPARLAATEKLVAAARAELDRARAALSTGLTDRKKFELDAEQWKDRIRKYKDQESQVRSNEAYKALVHETENAKAELDRAEERLLDRMMAVEELEKQVKAAELRLKEVEAEAAAERTRVEKEKAEVEAQLRAREADRARDTEGVPEDLLDHYERLARKHNGVALAQVRDDETCSMCRVKVRPHVFEALRNPASEELIHCETCTRILYYAGNPAAASPPARPATAGESG